MVPGSTDPTLSLSMQLRKQCSVFRTLRAETEVPSLSTLTSLSTTKEPRFCGWSVGWCENEPTQVTFANLMAPRLGQLGPKGRMWQFWEHKIFVLNLFPSSIYSASSLQSWGLKPSQAQAEVGLLSPAHMIQSQNSEYITQGFRVRQIFWWRWQEISCSASEFSRCGLGPERQLMSLRVLFTSFRNIKAVILVFGFILGFFAFPSYIDRC